MSSLVDAHALRPRHKEREQDFMCTSTLNNLFSNSVLGKKPDEIGDEPSDVENCKTDGNMLSTFARTREVSTRPVNAPGVNGNIWSTPASAQQASTRPVHAPPGMHPHAPGVLTHAVGTQQPRPPRWSGHGHALGGDKYPKHVLNELENNITCLLALPDGRMIVSNPKNIKISVYSVDKIKDPKDDKWFTIINLQSKYKEKIIREVSVSQAIGKSIKLESMNVDMIQPPSLAPLAIIEIDDPTKQVRVGDFISEVRGQSVLGMKPADVIRLINVVSYHNTVELKISGAVEVVVPMFKSFFVYSDNSVVVVDGNKLSLRPTWSATITPLAGHDSAGYVNGKAEDARFNNPRGVIVNPCNGDIIVADSGNNAIRLVTRDGTVTTLAGAPPPEPKDVKKDAKKVDAERRQFDIAERRQRDIAARRYLVATAASRRAGLPEIDGGSPEIDGGSPEIDGGSPEIDVIQARNRSCFCDETGSLARFNNPTHLAWDNNESIVVVDAGNHSVRRVTMQGVVSTVAGGGIKNGIKMGESGEADGEGIEARFNNPGSVVVDADGIIVVADTNNNRLCKIDGIMVTTVVNDNERRFRVGHDATQAPIFSPCEMTLDQNGDILIQGRPGTSYFCVVKMKLKEPAWFQMYWTAVTMRLSLPARHPMFSDLSPESLNKIMENILRTSLNYYFLKQSAEDTTMRDMTTRNLLAIIANRAKERIKKERDRNEEFQKAIVYNALQRQGRDTQGSADGGLYDQSIRPNKVGKRSDSRSRVPRTRATKGGAGAALPGR